MNTNLDRRESPANSVMERSHANSSHKSGWWLTRSNTVKSNPKPSR
jgi:hypothetical protein